LVPYPCIVYSTPLFSRTLWHWYDRKQSRYTSEIDGTPVRSWKTFTSAIWGPTLGSATPMGIKQRSATAHSSSLPLISWLDIIVKRLQIVVNKIKMQDGRGPELRKSINDSRYPSLVAWSALSVIQSSALVIKPVDYFSRDCSRWRFASPRS
jgi:hypothetical protein